MRIKNFTKSILSKLHNHKKKIQIFLFAPYQELGLHY